MAAAADVIQLNLVGQELEAQEGAGPEEATQMELMLHQLIAVLEAVVQVMLQVFFIMVAMEARE